MDLVNVLLQHKRWLDGDDGEKADLSGANMRGADMREADLKVFQSGLWAAYITHGHIRIGCQSHSLIRWVEFTDEEISKMHPYALAYWTENKKTILSIADSILKPLVTEESA